MLASFYLRHVLLALALVSAGCQKELETPPAPPPADAGLEQIQKAAKLVVLTRNGATTYFEDREGEPAGIEYDLAVEFARHLGVAVEFKVLDSVGEVLDALQSGEGDMAAAGLTRTPRREEKFLFGPAYQRIQQEVICEKNVLAERVTEPADLTRVKLLVTAESSYAERLTYLSEEFADIQWSTTEELSTEQVLQEVSLGRVTCTVADSNLLAVHRRYFLDLKPAFSLGESQELAWAMNPGQIGLHGEMTRFFEKLGTSGRLTTLLDKYYGYMNDFDSYDLKIYRKRIRERLPRYRELFVEAAHQYDLPWPLLAAVAYQESNWDPAARSPTGVRGLMMLTQSTADSLGVTDRLDPRQSVMGGARYLRRVIDRIPGHIDDTTRIWMGLAAYNVGYYHLRDARALAVFHDKDPNNWADVKSVLPLLSQKKHYRRLPHGYARGHEPVLYVDRVRNYMDLLLNHLNEREPTRATGVDFRE